VQVFAGFTGNGTGAIGRGAGDDFVLYTDMHAPTGYGFKEKALALQTIKEIEERLVQRAS
jgi:hypothetical protein